MNENPDDILLQRLRALPRDRLPPASSWQHIEAGLSNGRPVLSRARSRRWQWLAATAAAACLVLVAVSFPPSTPVVVSGSPDVAVSALQEQADSIADEYQMALQTLPQGQIPVELAPALVELDQSTHAIRSAIAQSPDAGFLLGQLQRTYALRLELTRQGLMATAGLHT